MDRMTRKAIEEAGKYQRGRFPLWSAPVYQLNDILFLLVSRRGTVDVATVQWVCEMARGEPGMRLEHRTKNFSIFAAIPEKEGIFPCLVDLDRETDGLRMMVYDAEVSVLHWEQPAP